MQQEQIKELGLTAANARLLGMEAVHHCGSGHIGGSLSAMDILTVLYFRVMRINPPTEPHDPRSGPVRFISKGHCTPALYPILALKGFFFFPFLISSCFEA